MTYSVSLHRDADKFLARLAASQPQDAEELEDRIEALAENPRPPGCKPLRGFKDVWRVRYGNYRICYQVDDGVLLVYVVTISKRDNVYDILRRRLGR